MQTRLKALSLALMLLVVPLSRVAHAQAPANDAENTAKIKAEVAKRIAGKKTKVKIKLRNGEELKGRIDQADDNGFTVTEDKTGKQTQVSYGEVARVKGRGMGTGTKIAIIVGVAVVVVAVVGVIAVKNADFFSGGIRIP